MVWSSWRPCRSRPRSSRARSSSVSVAPPGLAHSNRPPGARRGSRSRAPAACRRARRRAARAAPRHVVRRRTCRTTAGRVHRVVRIGEAHPAEERPVVRGAVLSQSIARSATHVVGWSSSASALRHVWRVVPDRAGRLGLHRRQPLVAALDAVAEQVPRVVQPERRRPEAPVPRAHESAMRRLWPNRISSTWSKPKYGPFQSSIACAPIPRPTRAARSAGTGTSWRSAPCRRSRCGARRGRRRSRPTARPRRRAGRAVARDAVGRRIRAGEDRRPRRLAERVLRAAAEKRVPCAASRSRRGVWHERAALRAELSARCWSVVMSRMFMPSPSCDAGAVGVRGSRAVDEPSFRGRAEPPPAGLGAAVDGDVVAGDERRQVGGEEQRDPRLVLRPAEATHGRPRRPEVVVTPRTR